MAGTVVSLHIATASHVPMCAISSAHLVPGRGIEGDRFYAARGKDPAFDEATCDVTLVEAEALEALEQNELQHEPEQSARRNIVIRGYPLAQLIGRTFRIGEVLLRGLEPHSGCCSSTNRQQASSCEAVQHADLRAMILTEGTIIVGDEIS